MKFVHADPEFRDLISIVATAQGIAEALVEKDYWVTHIILAKGRLPPLEISPRELAQEMFAQKQIRQIPSPADPAFLPSNQDPWPSIQNALEAIGPMFWGPRINLEDTMKTIRTWTQNLST